MAVNEGFIKEDARRIIISAPTAKELVLKLEVKSQSLLPILTHEVHSLSRLSETYMCDSQECVPEYEVGLVWEDQVPPPPQQQQHSFAPELEPGIASS